MLVLTDNYVMMELNFRCLNLIAFFRMQMKVTVKFVYWEDMSNECIAITSVTAITEEHAV